MERRTGALTLDDLIQTIRPHTISRGPARLDLAADGD